MRHFVCFPTADPKRGVECAWKWMEKGYDALIMLDKGVYVSDTLFSGTRPCLWDMHCSSDVFPGYYSVMNEIVAKAFGQPECADLVTCIGDDMDPPVQDAQKIADMYFSLFPDGFGVLQATGDIQGTDSTGRPAAARICGSPTFGRGWWSRAYQGRGPFWSEYQSYYGDEDLLNTAQRCRVLHQEPSVMIFHRHFSWGHQTQTDYQKRNNDLHWHKDRATFYARQIRGFPCSDPLPKQDS